MLTPTAHWSSWIHTPREFGSQSRAQDSTCTELHSCRLWPLPDPRCCSGEPSARHCRHEHTLHSRAEAQATSRARTHEGSPILAWAGFTPGDPTQPLQGLRSGHHIPATCLPLRDLLAAGLTAVLGHHPVTVRATQRPPSPSTECPSSLSGAARARAPTALAVETFEHLLLSDIRQRPPASPTPSLPLLTIPDSGPAPAKQGDTLGTDDSALCPLQTTTRH